MKIMFLMLFSSIVMVACQQHIKRNVDPSNYIPLNIREANKLGLKRLFKHMPPRANRNLSWRKKKRLRQQYGVFLPSWFINGYSGVLIKIPNTMLEQVDSTYVSSFYVDAMPVCNRHYRAFLEWCSCVYPTIPKIQSDLLPDTTIWLEHFPNEAIGGRLRAHYFRDLAFDYHPVVGVSWEQAQAYAYWRTDRINEAILIKNGYAAIDFDGQQGMNHFNTFNYLRGLHEVQPGDHPMIDRHTGEERAVCARDGILLPYLHQCTVQ